MSIPIHSETVESLNRLKTITDEIIYPFVKINLHFAGLLWEWSQHDRACLSYHILQNRQKETLVFPQKQLLVHFRYMNI